jgi:hypothetical protein
MHQENVIYYGTLQTTTEHYVVLCSKIQPTDVVEGRWSHTGTDLGL